jgi:NADH dehydrogenase
MPELHVVTGAFGYSGKYIARRLLDAGHRVRTLTNSPARGNPFGDAIDVHPLDFSNETGLARSLEGAAVLYNTYWVRFDHRGFTHGEAVANTQAFFRAAQKAGVGRIVHVSITNPSEDSDLKYFRGKGMLERALRETGIPHAVLRPAVLFGHEDILVNNIAWTLRRLPVFGVFGNGSYRLQPIHVDDFAALAVDCAQRSGNEVVNAIGPETYTYRGLVAEVGTAIGVRRTVVSVPPFAGYIAAWALGKLTGDVMLTRDEIRGLMRDLLYVDAPAAGTTRLSEWASAESTRLGRRYASELARRKDRKKPYAEL